MRSGIRRGSGSAKATNNITGGRFKDVVCSRHHYHRCRSLFSRSTPTLPHFHPQKMVVGDFSRPTRQIRGSPTLHILSAARPPTNTQESFCTLARDLLRKLCFWWVSETLAGCTYDFLRRINLEVFEKHIQIVFEISQKNNRFCPQKGSDILRSRLRRSLFVLVWKTCIRDPARMTNVD